MSKGQLVWLAVLVGCSGGHPNAKSPHIDRFGRSGMIFFQASLRQRASMSTVADQSERRRLSV